MKYSIGKALIAGGTGFLGYSTARLLSKRGLSVTALSSSPRPEWLDENIAFECLDLFGAAFDDIADMIKQGGFDTFFYALGPDDRVVPKAPAYDFFYQRLVEQAYKICSAAKMAGVKRCVVFGSYFTRFDQLLDGKLSETHPYIRARKNQTRRLGSLNESGVFEVMFLQLPYIFGVFPGKPPIWREALLSHFDGMGVVMFPAGGGTAVVTAEGVAEAAFAAACNGIGKGEYAVCQTNTPFKELIPSMLEAAGDHRHYIGVPAFICSWWASGIARRQRRLGLESGLNLAKLMTGIQSKKFYLDSDKLKKELNYAELGLDGGDNVIATIEKSMRACYPERFENNAL